MNMTDLCRICGEFHDGGCVKFDEPMLDKIKEGIKQTLERHDKDEPRLVESLKYIVEKAIQATRERDIEVVEKQSLGWYEGDGYEMKPVSLLSGKEMKEAIAQALRNL